MLSIVKVALRVTTTAYDTQLNMLIEAAKQDLGIAGVVLPSTLDDICKQAVISYCKLHFGNPDNPADLKKTYDEQKAQLSMASGYTDWSS